MFRHFWAILSLFRAEGHFLFFGQFFPIFGFRPVFHSMPGGLTSFGPSNPFRMTEKLGGLSLRG